MTLHADAVFAAEVRLFAGRLDANTEAASHSTLTPCECCGARAAPRRINGEWRMRTDHGRLEGGDWCPRRPKRSTDRRWFTEGT